MRAVPFVTGRLAVGALATILAFFGGLAPNYPLAGAAMAREVSGDAIRLDINEARKLAAIMLRDGQSGDARTLALGLLKRDPRDVDALLILAQSEFRLGNLDQAVRAGRRAFAAARTDAARYQAAHVTAAALNLDGAHTRSQIWLRRAAQHAPDDGSRQQVRRDFRSVAAANPLEFSLNFGLRPSSNINNGSQHDTEQLGGLTRVLDGSEKALSGLEYSLDADLRYRLSESKRRRFWVGASALGLGYALSDEAKTIAPNARAQDFSYLKAGVNLGADLRDASGRGETLFQFSLAQVWSGGHRTTHSAEVSATRRHLISPTAQLQLRASAEKRWNPKRPIEDSVILTLSGSWQKRLVSGAQLGLELGVSDSDSHSYRTASQAVFAGASLSLAKPVLGAETNLWARMQMRDFDLPFLVFDAREDTRISIGTTLFFRDLDYYGFAPTLDIGYSRSRSNIGAYDGRSFGVGVGVRSVF